jgi:hypothetical protein
MSRIPPTLRGKDARTVLEIATGKRPARRGRPEEEMQMRVMEALVGRIGPGPREPGGGLSAKYPELFLAHAIPNGMWTPSAAAAGRAKAAGVLASMPDLHLPVARGPFIGLYVELKAPGKYGRPDQRRMAELLRAEGNCVIECRSVEHAVSVFAGYLALPKNRPSIRPLGGFYGNIEDGIRRWRIECHELLAAALA